MTRYCLALSFILLSAGRMQAQAGPCTESAIKQGHLPVAADAFEYMPPYGKPAVGKSAIKTADTKSFSGRTNIKSSWAGDHRIVSSPAGDMAYEYGTLAMSYDESGQRQEFKAVILNVYKAKDGVCQNVAGTMQPLEEQSGH